MRSFSSALRLVVLAAAAGALGGCSEYLDHRDTISIMGGNAVQTDKVTMMVDPWPRASADRDIAFNGQMIEEAVTRYRTGHVKAPNATGAAPGYSNGAGNGAPAATGPDSAPAPTPSPTQ